MAKRPRAGDVLEIAAPNGFIYLHYLGKSGEYGDAVLVSPMVYGGRQEVSSALFREAYVAFYPAAAAVSRALAQVVGHLPSSAGVPNRLRRPGVRCGREIKTWIVEDSTGEYVRDTLSEEERQLPIAAIWNHALLVQRVTEGWRPQMEGEDD